MLNPPGPESLLLIAEADAEAETAAGTEGLDVGLEVDTLVDDTTVLTALGTV